MIVASLEMNLRLEGCESLKDKRRILRSLLDKARNQFHVSIAEVDDQELWQNACIGAACVSNNAVHAKSVLQQVLELFETTPAVQIEGISEEVYRS
ncbi:MAG TPA: DUF503 domain-containing protein [Fimbriimonadaceae bacterium]|jgi:hypothetical protein